MWEASTKSPENYCFAIRFKILPLYLVPLGKILDCSRFFLKGYQSTKPSTCLSHNFRWTSYLYIDALIQMTLYCYFSWWYSNTLQDCTPLQFLETKTGAPLVVLHPPPVKKRLLSPPFLKTKTGAPFVVLDPPPQNNNSHKNTRFLLFPFSCTSFAQTQDPSQTLT